MKAINLKTENLINPIGIDIQNPRLMWTCSGGKTQSAYRIDAAWAIELEKGNASYQKMQDLLKKYAEKKEKY